MILSTGHALRTCSASASRFATFPIRRSPQSFAACHSRYAALSVLRRLAWPLRILPWLLRSFWRLLPRLPCFLPMLLRSFLPVLRWFLLLFRSFWLLLPRLPCFLLPLSLSVRIQFRRPALLGSPCERLAL